MNRTPSPIRGLVVVVPPVPPDVHQALIRAGYELACETDRRVEYRPRPKEDDEARSSASAIAMTAPAEALLFTPPAAAAILGISRSTLYLLLAQGRIPSVKIGSLRRIPRASLENYVGELSATAVG